MDFASIGPSQHERAPRAVKRKLKAGFALDIPLPMTDD
jgi:hypothetical protein